VEREAARYYERSAHLVTVKWKAHYSPFWFHFLENFLYQHEAYVDPRLILELKNVSLFQVTRNYALFCVTAPDVDIYDTKKYPFMFVSHYDKCEKIIILPINSFHKLAAELGDPDVPVVINHMTNRCGSTLISQMLNKIPEIRVLSEPWGACTIHGEAARGKISEVCVDYSQFSI